MIIPLKPDRKRIIISLKIQASMPLSIGIVAFDPTVPNTHYLRRRVGLTSKDNYTRTIRIPLPVSPRYLVLDIYNKNTGQDQGFHIRDFKVESMPPVELWATSERHRFMDFAIGFAEKAGHLKPGFYPSENDEFLIQLLPSITDEDGTELATPARIHRQMPRVQLSARMIRKMSIPIRVAILSHEGCHYFKNTRSETKADLCGIRYYLDYGFPTIEAVYAATKVFTMTPGSIGPAHVDRTKDILQFIENYKKQKAA